MEQGVPQKLLDCSQLLKPFTNEETPPILVSSLPTTQYRAKLTLQLLNEVSVWSYATRKEGRAVAVAVEDAIQTANHRIQQVLRQLLMVLNNTTTPLQRALTSVTVASSWSGTNDACQQSDCIVTLHYEAPLPEISVWMTWASEHLLEPLSLLQVRGRSKKRILCVGKAEDNLLRDSLHLQKDDSGSWHVSVVVAPQGRNDYPKKSPNSENVRIIQYAKNPDAFFHPNPHVMCYALGWMLTRLDGCCTGGTWKRILELYSGCGAHTVALATVTGSSRSSITAVEYDARLVEACRATVALQGEEFPTISLHTADAGMWCEEQLRRGQVDSLPNGYDIWVVDPPRYGLCKKVIQSVAVAGPRDVLYISCGPDALLNDMKQLTNAAAGGYRIMDCHILDLFPGTHSVESLVHLRRHCYSGE